jgi:DNA-binding NtrC family response regulator
VIILVEDDADQRVALKLALQLAGYSVREAANGREALALQRERPSRVLVTDIFMPEADGFELIQAFRNEFPQTRIVVVSGGGKLAKGDYLATAQLMGVDATLQKPFDIQILLETLRRWSASTM